MEITQLPVANSIDGVQDTFPIVTHSLNSTQQISRNTFLGLSSAPVGLTDSQTLTNKTLTSPTINGATLSGTLSGTYTIGGTPTFPSSVTQNTATQTLTNKTLTSPTINSPTITNATISADTVSGYTTSNSGSIYGISVTTGQITTANSIASGTIVQGGVSGSQLATSAITLGYAQITSSFTTTSTTAVQVTGLTATVTVPGGGRKVKVTFFGLISVSGAGVGLYPSIWKGTVGSGTQLQQLAITSPNTSYGVNGTTIAVDTPSAGSVTYSIGFKVDANTGTVSATSTSPAFILVEAI